jgi:hypothetical protein
VGVSCCLGGSPEPFVRVVPLRGSRLEGSWDPRRPLLPRSRRPPLPSGMPASQRGRRAARRAAANRSGLRRFDLGRPWRFPVHVLPRKRRSRRPRIRLRIHRKPSATGPAVRPDRFPPPPTGLANAPTGLHGKGVAAMNRQPGRGCLLRVFASYTVSRMASGFRPRSPIAKVLVVERARDHQRGLQSRLPSLLLHLLPPNALPFPPGAHRPDQPRGGSPPHGKRCPSGKPEPPDSVPSAPSKISSASSPTVPRKCLRLVSTQSSNPTAPAARSTLRFFGKQFLGAPYPPPKIAASPQI